MISNIIKIPERCHDNGIYENYWRLYEESYKSNTIFSNYEITKVTNKNDIFVQVEKIYDIKHNFYKANSEIVINSLLSQFLKKYIEDFNDDLQSSTKDFFKTGKLDDILIIYLKSCKDTDISLMSNITDVINDHLSKIDKNVEVNLIKFKFYLNKFINILSKFDKENIILSFTMKEISFNFMNLLDKNLENKGLQFINILFSQSVFKNIFQEEKLIKYFNNSDVNDFSCKLFNLIFNMTDENINDNTFAENVYDVIKLFNIISSTKDINFDNFTDINKFTNYMCASLYYNLNASKINNVKDIIKFHYNTLPNKLDFLAYYKHHLQWRATNKLNYEFENIAFKFIQDIYIDDEYKKIIDNIKNCLDDILMSEMMNKEIKELDITVNTDKFKHVEFNKNKLDVLITSCIIWEDIKSSNLYSKLNMSTELELYSTIVKNYYEKKYTSSEQNRLLNISYDESHVDISLGKANIRLPFTYYTVLENIGNVSHISFEELVRATNIDEDKVKMIVNIFKINNIISEGSEKLYFNCNFLKNEVSLNLMQSNKTFDTIVEEEITYDKDMMIDALIIRVCKKQYQNEMKEMSFGRLMMITRGELKQFFIPNEKLIKTRLERLVTLEYLSKNEEYNKYCYIP